MAGNGSLIVTWSSYGQYGSSYGVYARRYDANGNALGNEFLVNAHTSGTQKRSKVAITTSGNFFLTWESSGQDGSDYGIYAQQYTSTGARQGTEFRVNSTTSGVQKYSSMAMNGDGEAVLVWSGNGSGDSEGVFARRYAVTFGAMHPMLPFGGCGCGACSAAVAEVAPNRGDSEMEIRPLQGVAPDAGRGLALALSSSGRGQTNFSRAADENGEESEDTTEANGHGQANPFQVQSVLTPRAGRRVGQVMVGDPFSICAPAFGVSWQWL